MTSEPEVKRLKVPPDDGTFDTQKNNEQTITEAQILESLRTMFLRANGHKEPTKSNQQTESEMALELQTARETIDHLRKDNQRLKEDVDKKDIFVSELLKKLSEAHNLISNLQTKLRNSMEPKSNPASPHSSPGPVNTSPAPFDSSSVPHLKVIQQPPSHAVYQRILKPFPTVAVMGVTHLKNCQNLFVEVCLVKQEDQDSGAESINNVVCKGGGSALEGEKRNLIGGQLVQRSTESHSPDCLIVVFKKLKVLTTNSQQGTDFFLLKFTLKRYVDNIFETVPNVATVYSDPFEVFSHTLYLKDKNPVAPKAAPKRKGSPDVTTTAPTVPSTPEITTSVLPIQTAPLSS